MRGRPWRALLIGVGLAATAAGCAPAPERPPNVLLVVLDTARADAFSGVRSAGASTPVYARLAESGVRFRNVRSTSAWTLPSHASLFTGLYPSRHGAHHESHRLAADHVTLAELLAGSHDAAGFSENPHIGRAKGFAQGFAVFEETWRLRRERGETPPTIDRALAWLRSRGDAPSRPFLLFLNLMDPHLPYNPPEPFSRRFLPSGLEPATVSRLREVSEREARLFMAGRLRFTSAELEGLRSLYRAEVAYADSRVGRVLDALRESAELDRTLVVLLSDHGENVGEHGLMEHQLSLYETLLRIPLVLRLPGVFEGGESRDEPRQLVDVFPTVLEVVGVPRDRWPPMEGQSLADRDVEPTRPLYAEYMRPIRQRARFLEVAPDFDFDRFDRRLRSIQVGHLKLILSDRGAVELYDLASDPAELRDVSRDRPRAVHALREQLERWASAAGRRPPEPEPDLDPATLEALRELGYVE